MILIKRHIIINFSALHTDVDQLKEYIIQYRTELTQWIFGGQLIDKQILNHLYLIFYNIYILKACTFNIY